MSNCTPLAGYFGQPPGPVAACPANTASPPGAAARTDCRPAVGYFGAPGDSAVRCLEVLSLLLLYNIILYIIIICYQSYIVIIYY